MQTWRRIRAEEEGRQLDLTVSLTGVRPKAYHGRMAHRSRTCWTKKMRPEISFAR